MIEPVPILTTEQEALLQRAVEVVAECRRAMDQRGEEIRKVYAELYDLNSLVRSKLVSVQFPHPGPRHNVDFRDAAT